MGQRNDRDRAEVKSVILSIASAKRRTSRARATLARRGAEERVVSALAVAEQALDSERQRLMQVALEPSSENQSSDPAASSASSAQS